MGTTYLAPRVDIGGHRRLQIGQLTAEVGLNPKTIRYYETIGLLPVPQRTETGYRLYTDVDVERLRFVRKAKMLGLSLDEIRDTFRLLSDGKLPCRCVLGMLEQQVAAVDAQLRALEAFRQELMALRRVHVAGRVPTGVDVSRSSAVGEGYIGENAVSVHFRSSSCLK